MEDVDDYMEDVNDDDYAHVRVTSLFNPIWNRNKDLKLKLIFIKFIN
jgi:hypothetical protein